MKIGEFASSNKISIDTVRHYVDLGLIIPELKGAQFTYDGTCKNDLQEILDLKAMGFTLNEVKAVLTFKRLGKLASYRENPSYRSIFEKRYGQIRADMERLQASKARLENRLLELERASEGGCRHGFDFRRLGLFCCAGCGSDLALSEARISDNLITDARLDCKCGRHYAIEDGILVAGQIKRAAGGFDDSRITDYIETTDEAYLKNVYREMEWISRKLDRENPEGRVFLELGSGYGFFLRHIYERLPDDAVYIAADHDVNMHRLLKSMLEKNGARKNILFVCCDFSELPLKKGAADLLLDLAGTSNYSFEHEEFLPEKMEKYLKPGAYLLGSYILFGKFAVDTLIEERLRKNFNPGHIRRMLESSGFEVLEEAAGDFLERGGKYESYFRKGEKVYSCALHARKRG